MAKKGTRDDQRCVGENLKRVGDILRRFIIGILSRKRKLDLLEESKSSTAIAMQIKWGSLVEIK